MKWKCLQCLLAVLVHHHGGQVVSVLAFYSDNHSSNPAAARSFGVKLCVKERLNINSVFLSARKSKFQLSFPLPKFVCFMKCVVCHQTQKLHWNKSLKLTRFLNFQCIAFTTLHCWYPVWLHICNWEIQNRFGTSETKFCSKIDNTPNSFWFICGFFQATTKPFFNIF